MVTSLASGAVVVVVAITFFLVPGVLLLRRNRLGVGERFVIAIALSVAMSTGTLTGLGLVFGLSIATLAVAATIVTTAAARFPLPSDALTSGGSSRFSEISAAAFFAIAAIQALRPRLFTTLDAQALWVPLADSIARSGNLTPAWVPSVLKGFPPGIALLAGTVSVPVGRLHETFALLIPPMFGALTVLVAGLIANRFRVPGAVALTVAILFATPLIGRAIAFHDDLIVGFLVATAVYIALGAQRWPGWAAAGVAAGGALAVKPPGVVAGVLVVVLLLSRRATPRDWIGVAAGAVLGLPWYLGNLIRLGDPIYPFLSTVGNRALRLIVDDQVAFLAARAPDRLELLGWLALGLMSVGVGIALAGLARRDRVLAAGLAAVLVLGLAIWMRSNYGTRQLLAVYPVYAALAGLGLASVGQRLHRTALRTPVAVVALVWTLLFGFTVWNVRVESEGKVPSGERTGLYALAIGKWWQQSFATTLYGPHDNQVFGPITEIWERLRRADSSAVVLSFDARSWYIPQRVLSAAEDAGAVRAYLAGDATAQQRALWDAGVRFVLTRRAVDRHHRVLYELGPWRELERRPELYRRVVRNKIGGLYELVAPRPR